MRYFKLKKRIQLVMENAHPFRLILSYFLRKSGLSSLIVFDRVYYKLRFHPTALMMHMFADKKAREEEVLYLISLLTPNSNVIDVGANVGTISIPLAKFVRFGKVFSIEAHPRIYNYLKKNVELNNLTNVELFNLAIGDKKGHVFFSDISSDDMNRVIKDKSGIDVETRRLDEIIPKHLLIRLLKIDTEGYELFVLKGCKNILENVEIIYFESFEEHFNSFGYSTKDILGFLKENNFIVFRITGEGFETVSDGYISNSCENLIAANQNFNLKKVLWD